MALVSGSTASSSGLIHYSPSKLPWRVQRPIKRLVSFIATPVQSSKTFKTRIQACSSNHFGPKFAIFASSGGKQIQTEGSDSPEESFWISLYKEAYWGLKSVIGFLLEQPSQLKYIEWPAFQSTLKTAILTLVLVAMLIIALASIDSALSFLLALILRRSS